MNTWTGTERDAAEIFRRALEGCDVRRAMTELLLGTRSGEKGEGRETGALQIDLCGVRRLLIIAMGKAAGGMLEALLSVGEIASGREIEGVLVAPEPLAPMPAGFHYYRGSHPLPSEESFAAARAVLGMLDREPAAASTFCFFLVSGGASAMFELPIDEAITVEETIALNLELVLSGASIAEINCVRKHFSQVKGGRLAQRAAHLRSVTLLVSDVPQERVDALASGPTLPDPSTVEDCREVLRRYELLERLPQRVRSFFVAEELPETPKSGVMFREYRVLLSEADLARQAALAAEALGYRVFFDWKCDEWDYRRACDYLLDRVRALHREYGRVCLVSVGEVLVRVQSKGKAGGVGGRNQHFVLYAGTRLGDEDAGLAVLSCGSDGVDGNSTRAGGVISREAMGRTAGGPGAEEALRGFESSPWLEGIGRTIHTGPSGINLRDLRLLVW